MSNTTDGKYERLMWVIRGKEIQVMVFHHAMNHDVVCEVADQDKCPVRQWLINYRDEFLDNHNLTLEELK